MLLVVVGLTAMFLPPLLFCIWMYFNRASSRTHWWIIVFLAFSSVLVLACNRLDMDLHGFEPVIPLAIFLLFFVLGYKKQQRHPLPIIPPRRALLFIWLAIVFTLGMKNTLAIAEVITVRFYPKDKALALEFPLKGKGYYVLNGGSSSILNHHYSVKAQKYALDIVQKNEKGDMTTTPLSKINTDYVVYGAPIIAPCKGEVVNVVGDQLDKEALWFGVDMDNTLGNFIALYCEDFTVVFAHLKPGSLKVAIGDKVEVAQEIAQVGNTGNTTQPHLHIHAVKGKQTDKKMLLTTGEGLPVLYNGQYLTRDDMVNHLVEEEAPASTPAPE